MATIQFFREDSEYLAEYVSNMSVGMGRSSKVTMILPKMIRITRKIPVTCVRTKVVYPAGSRYYLSCNPIPKFWSNMEPYVRHETNHGGASLKLGATSLAGGICVAGVTPGSYYGETGFSRGWYYVQDIVRFESGMSDEDIRQHNYYKHGICGIAMQYSGTREVWSGEASVYFHSGAGSESRIGWPRSMHNWNGQSLVNGGVPLYMTDWHRWSYFRIISSMSRGGKEGASCGLITWTTQYFDESDMVSFGYRIM